MEREIDDIMAKQKYALNPGEKIVYKTSCVRHGFWGAYTHALTITNQSVILEKYGMVNNFKGIERFDYPVINQAVQGEASNGEKQLELYIGGKVEDFALQSGDENEMKILVMAINDQMGPDADKEQQREKLVCHSGLKEDFQGGGGAGQGQIHKNGAKAHGQQQTGFHFFADGKIDEPAAHQPHQHHLPGNGFQVE